MVTGKNVSRSEASETAPTPMMVFRQKEMPNTFRLIRIKGRLINKIVTPIGNPNKWFSTVDMPVAPPITMSAGTKNILTLTPNRTAAMLTMPIS